ncbi:Transcriptional activator hac1 [Cyphellophora attinorum]|uniref:Transcriptional activator hac1 n=1 Tax=Cyphellophora attinorum TaxID=1664694 RepID=A0A0N1HES4_9EURO|nr:Transcriptional activator hac1 [Phialophora attinorum]KPI44020.1 Transcriptional activator hac1 [Phialophora attinorum]
MPRVTKKNTTGWGKPVELGPIVIGPGKRAKTEAEKEQRKKERVLRNRRAAQKSREKKNTEVEALRLENERLRTELRRYRASYGILKPADDGYSFQMSVDPVAYSTASSSYMEDNERNMPHESSSSGMNSTNDSTETPPFLSPDAPTPMEFNDDEHPTPDLDPTTPDDDDDTPPTPFPDPSEPLQSAELDRQQSSSEGVTKSHQRPRYQPNMFQAQLRQLPASNLDTDFQMHVSEAPGPMVSLRNPSEDPNLGEPWTQDTVNPLSPEDRTITFPWDS